MSSSTPPPAPASSITLVLALFLAPTVRAGIVTEYLVDTTVDSLALDQCNDSVPADCSLRAAVQLADNDGGDSRIFLGNGVHRLTIAGAEEDANATGDLDLRNATGVFEILNIPGTHPVIEQATDDRIFDIVASVEFTLDGPITLRGGRAVTGSLPSGGQIRASGLDNSDQLILKAVHFVGGHAARNGGCLSALISALTIVDSTFSNCSSGERGGAATLASGPGPLQVQRTTWSGNQAGLGGGALYFSSAGVGAQISDSIFRGNAAGLEAAVAAFGGALLDEAGAITIRNSEFSQNTAGALTLPESFGGAIATLASEGVDLENVTISHNRILGLLKEGVGISADSDLQLRHVTVVEPSASQGAGEAAIAISSQRDVTFDNSIVVGGCTEDGAAVVSDVSLGGNVEQPADDDVLGQTTCNFVELFDSLDADAGLRMLGPYGSILRTHALTATSPAINNGGLFGNPCSAVDQRGAGRDQIRPCDAGAHERDPLAPPPDQGELFADGFQAGSTAGWSSTRP